MAAADRHQQLSIGSRKHARWASILGGSAPLHEAIARLAARALDVHPADWFAAYLLLCLSRVFPGGFVGGRLAPLPPLGGDAAAFPRSQVRWPVAGEGAPEERCVDVDPQLQPASTLQLGDVAGLVLAPCDVRKVGGPDTTVLSVLRRFQLSSVPVFVNECVACWAAGRRPLVLMCRAASPVELMEMQAAGRRCVTCFCRAEELGREHVDAYPPFAAKDALHFALHDLQHMEKFVQPEFFAEQVGFLHRMRAVHAWLRPRPSAGGGEDGAEPEGSAGLGGPGPEGADLPPPSLLSDRALRQDVGHCISDMNTCVIHMLSFLLQRWECCSHREVEAGRLSAAEAATALRQERAAVLDLLIGAEVEGRALGSPPPDDMDFAIRPLREHFRRVGCQQLGEAVRPPELDGGTLMQQRWPSLPSQKERERDALSSPCDGVGRLVCMTVRSQCPSMSQ